MPKCFSCNGSGKSAFWIKCNGCRGTGKVPCPFISSTAPWDHGCSLCDAYRRHTCLNCNGQKQFRQKCCACNGSGRRL